MHLSLQVDPVMIGSRLIHNDMKISRAQRRMLWKGEYTEGQKHGMRVKVCGNMKMCVKFVFLGCRGQTKTMLGKQAE